MPLHWDEFENGAPETSGAPSQSRPVARISVWPHRSLPRRGFATFIGITFVFLLMPLIPLLGSPVLWGLLPFLMGVLALTWFLIERSYRDGRLTEVLTVWTNHMELVRVNPRGPEQRWEANPFWVRVEMHGKSGPVENYITLHGGDRVVELGAFLSPEEREDLFRRLNGLLSGLRR